MEGDDVVEPLSIVPSAAAPEPEGQAAGASPVPRAQSSTYDRSKGVETWPEYPEEIPYHIKLIQGISNHGGAFAIGCARPQAATVQPLTGSSLPSALEVIIIVAIVINTVTLAVQVRPRPSASHVGTAPPASAPFCLPICLLLPVTSASQSLGADAESGKSVRLRFAVAQPVPRSAGPGADDHLHVRAKLPLQHCRGCCKLSHGVVWTGWRCSSALPPWASRLTAKR